MNNRKLLRIIMKVAQILGTSALIYLTAFEHHFLKHNSSNLILKNQLTEQDQVTIENLVNKDVYKRVRNNVGKLAYKRNLKIDESQIIINKQKKKINEAKKRRKEIEQITKKEIDELNMTSKNTWLIATSEKKHVKNLKFNESSLIKNNKQNIVERDYKVSNNLPNVQQTIIKWATKVGIPIDVAFALGHQESNLKHFDKNGNVIMGDKGKATGMFQIHQIALKDLQQSTGKNSKYQVGMDVDLTDLDQNVEVALKYYAKQLAAADGDHSKAIRMYNGGFKAKNNPNIANNYGNSVNKFRQSYKFKINNDKTIKRIIQTQKNNVVKNNEKSRLTYSDLPYTDDKKQVASNNNQVDRKSSTSIKKPIIKTDSNINNYGLFGISNAMAGDLTPEQELVADKKMAELRKQQKIWNVDKRNTRASIRNHRSAGSLPNKTIPTLSKKNDLDKQKPIIIPKGKTVKKVVVPTTSTNKKVIVPTTSTKMNKWDDIPIRTTTQLPNKNTMVLPKTGPKSVEYFPPRPRHISGRKSIHDFRTNKHAKPFGQSKIGQALKKFGKKIANSKAPKAPSIELRAK